MQKIKAYWKDFMRYRFLLYNLVGRDFKLKYRRSILGVVWSVLNPLMMSMVMVVVFSSVFNQRGEGVNNFPVYLMMGQLMFTFFNESTHAAMGSVFQASALLKKVYLPKYIFPLEKVCFSLVNTCFSFVALIIVMFFTGAGLYKTTILIVYPLLTMFVFNLGVGLFLATMAVFFRDIMHLWGVFTTALMYFSAIFYDISIFTPFLQALIQFNPVYWYITTFRQVALYGLFPTGRMLGACAGFALLALVVGLAVFRKGQDKFVLYM
ncbi:ABC transporter permease [Ruminococcaceae bacterium OttesenSCG-928-N02]|nr:ABC transporter permease [Ruminococcaceae bacterium OttesenSCG-928-N02]